MKKETIIQLVAGLLILLFTYTAISKLLQFDTFRFVLRTSPLIGNKFPYVAWSIPTAELIISVLLLIPRTRIIGLHCAAFLMTVFTLYVGYMLLFADHLPCSCGGVLSQLSWNSHLYFNIAFTLLALFSIWLEKKNNNTNSLSHAMA